MRSFIFRISIGGLNRFAYFLRSWDRSKVSRLQRFKVATFQGFRVGRGLYFPAQFHFGCLELAGRRRYPPVNALLTCSWTRRVASSWLPVASVSESKNSKEVSAQRVMARCDWS